MQERIAFETGDTCTEDLTMTTGSIAPTRGMSYCIVWQRLILVCSFEDL